MAGRMRREDWSEIIEFLGLRPDVKFPSGWIPAGFRKNEGHDAMSMRISARKPNPYTYGDLTDIAVIVGVAYVTVVGDRFLACCHHVNVKPKAHLVLKVTPETFATFRDRWFAELADVAPDLEMYREYGVRAHAVDAENRLDGHKVRWRRAY